MVDDDDEAEDVEFVDWANDVIPTVARTPIARIDKAMTINIFRLFRAADRAACLSFRTKFELIPIKQPHK